MADGTRQPRPLDPQAADLLSRIQRLKRAPYWQLQPAEVRDINAKATQVLEIKAAVVADTRELRIPAGADASIEARLYTGMEAGDPAPLVIFSHGGGFTIGSMDTYDSVCRMIANGARCKVLSLEYRLAPEFRFPTAAEDVYAAWRWAFAEHRQLGIDPGRIAGMGDSAGGTLTAQAALRARDDGLPLAAQVLLYPGTCAWQDTPSHHVYGEGYLLDAKTIQWFFGLYLRNDADRMDWRFAPLDAPEFVGLAPAYLQLAECDPLVDEGQAYAEKLELARVPVRTKVYPGMLHGFYNMGGALRVAREAHQDTVDYLRAVFDTSKSA